MTVPPGQNANPASPPEVRSLPIARLKLNGPTQIRAGVSAATVDHYATMMQEGHKFPPIVVHYDGADYWVSDGHHRCLAAQQIQLITIDAQVHPGTQRDAVLAACAANASHGLPRSREDKRRAVGMLLADEEWSQLSDREIARRTGTSHTFVAGIRTPTTTDAMDEATTRQIGLEYRPMTDGQVRRMVDGAAVLIRLEREIRDGLSDFLDVAEALRGIRDGALYQDTHQTFEAYCVARGVAPHLVALAFELQDILRTAA
jgi:hypothetical protein